MVRSALFRVLKTSCRIIFVHTHGVITASELSTLLERRYTSPEAAPYDLRQEGRATMYGVTLQDASKSLHSRPGSDLETSHNDMQV